MFKESYLKLHSVLTYKLEKKEMGCINRDLNSVLNMVKIIKEEIETGKRPEKYTRQKEKKIKPINRNVKLWDALEVRNSERLIKKHEKQIKEDIKKGNQIMIEYQKIINQKRNNRVN